MLFVVLCPGTPKGSTSSGSGFKAAVVLVLKRLRRRGNGLKSHPTDWEKPGIEPSTPGLQDIGLSPTPFFVAFLGINQFCRVGLRFVLVFITGTPKGSPKVVLWRSRESNLRPLVYKAWRLSPTPRRLTPERYFQQ